MEEVYTTFLELEQSHDLYDIRIKGVPVWERVRKEVFDELVLQNVPPAMTSDSEPSGKKTFFWEFLVNGGFLDLILKNPLLASKHDLVFVNGRREKMGDGFWWNLYCDPVCEGSDLSCLHLDPSDHYRESPLKTQSVRPVKPLAVMGRMRELMRNHFDGVPESVTRRLVSLERDISSTFHRDIDVLDRVRRHFLRRSRLLPMYERTLQRVDPEVAVAIPSWAGREVFIEACKHTGVPVIEIQHGTPNKYHLGYSYPNGTKEAFPDYLFTWGEFWTEDLKLPIPDERVFHVGFPALEMRRAEHPPDDRADRLVVISQPTVGKELSRLAVGLEEHVGIDLAVTYKLHPGEYSGWRDAYPWLDRSEVEVIGGDGQGLYQLFSQAKAQLGVYSTAIYEGLTYGLRTFLLDIEEIEFMDKLVVTGAVDTVSTADQVAKGLDSPAKGEVEIERLFRSNAIHNIRSRLNEVIR